MRGNKIRTAGADERTGQQRISPLHPKAQEGQAWMKFTISSFSVRKVFQNKHTVHTHVYVENQGMSKNMSKNQGPRV
jgi:hypothetical protein